MTKELINQLEDIVDSMHCCTLQGSSASAAQVMFWKVKVREIIKAASRATSISKSGVAEVPAGWKLEKHDDESITVQAPSGERWRYQPCTDTGTDSAFIYSLFSALAAAPAAPAADELATQLAPLPNRAGTPDLHDKIMNLSAWPSDDTVKHFDNPVIAYKLGHRDARHAAAELVLSAVVAPTAAPVVLPAPDGHVRVPLEFVRRFNTLAHNYSLIAEAPDHYFGVERDAFRDAYARCGRDLAELRPLLAGVSTIAD